MNCIYCHRPAIRKITFHCASCNIEYIMNDKGIADIIIDHQPWPLIINLTANTMSIYNSHYQLMGEFDLEWLFPENIKQFHQRLNKLLAFL